MSSKGDECVRVMVRIRPLNGKEKQDGRKIVATANFDRAEINLSNPEGDASEPPKVYTFDAAFPAETTQQQVYDTAATEIVEAVMDGYNGTVFAYGQTGAGKSHTMEGYPEPAELRGIIPNSFKHIFDKVAILKNKQFLVRASYLEIYNEEIRDLLSKDPKCRLELKENIETGVYVKDLTSIAVKDAIEIDHVMKAGKKNRSVGATLMNQTSSRSHSIFTIVVECASEGLDGNGHICVGKLNLVDLAGSERQSKTGATGDRLKEATKINLSLSALGNVISALVESKKNKHVPYRDSKLTRLLQDSLGGNTKTVMIANCGPADYNYEETNTTLRYASRAKNIKNKPKINEDPKDAMLREYQEEIALLKEQIRLKAAGGGMTTTIVDGKEVHVPAGAAPKEIVEVEKVVEKVVVEKGISEKEMKEIQEKARREKEEMMKNSMKQISAAAKEKAEAENTKKEIELKLLEEQQNQERIREEQAALEKKLSQMQAKLLIGGEMMDKAKNQEDELRKATLELQERKRQELQLARELAEREEANLMMEEQYTSLQEEAEAKTKKLKKVWTKVKEIMAETKQMQKTFEREREDMLDTIRELAGQLKLESLILDYFVPSEYLQRIEQRAKWNEEEDNWVLARLDLSGNAQRPRQRPASASGLRRPETTEKSRKKFAKPGLNQPEIQLNEVRNPYLVYTGEDGDGFGQASDVKPSKEKSKDRSKSSSKSKSRSKRPATASRRQDE